MISRLIEHLPLRRKLMVVIVAICSLVLLLAGAALLVVEMVGFRRTMIRDATVLADVIGKNTQAALTFQDADGARGLLKALQAEPEIDGARIFDQVGAPFVDYVREGMAVGMPAHPAADGAVFVNSHLALVRAIELDGKRIGTIYVQVGLDGMYHRLYVFAGLAALVVAVAAALALLLSARLQRPISRPILNLAEIAREIAEKQDYSLRAPVHGRDEVGLMAEAFNHMLTRIQAQNLALREGEDRLRTVLDSAMSAVVVVDGQGRISDWNARAAAMFGRPRAEVLGQELGRLVLPDRHRDPARPGLPRHPGISPPAADKDPAATPASAIGHLAEMMAWRQDGSEFPVELAISPLNSGGTVAFCAFITDITERKQAETRLLAQLGRLALLNRITRAIGERQDLPSIFQVVVASLEDDLPIDFGSICLYDGAAKTLTVANVGSASADLAHKLAMLPEAQIPIDPNGLSRCIAGKLVYEPDVAALAQPFPQHLAGGGLRALVAVPLVVESQVFGVLIAARRAAHSFSSAECEFLRQLADQVALAAHQTQLNDALQRAYDDLRQTQQTVMQQERLRALGQMASGIAHDINNAISPVSLYTESMLETEKSLSPRSRSYLETIKRAIEDVAHTVARMREFYRQRETQLVFTPVDANQMVEQVIDLSRARWNDMPQQRGVEVKAVTELGENLPMVQGIPSEIREALINLVFNAVDAMPNGGTVTLRTRFRPAHDSLDGPRQARVLIEVTDGGVGMDDETRRRCLEPFFTTKGERGTGLGLAMVYGVVQRHGGEIEIDSTPQVGTTMRLCFQVMNEPGAVIAGENLPVPTRLRLLLVDDDAILLKSLRDILETDGHLVTAANRGQTGIDTFRAALGGPSPFTLVITDLGMPTVDGRRVAAAVKEASPFTPVIMLTGWGQRLVAEGEVPPHVDRVLNKPPNLTELRQALAYCCNLRLAAT